ncbi:shikimate kinase [Desulfuromonas carbonis]|uniref:shikimate kinase n=1 Tax=Desulfuromonas sp. DDH964 TaxID=1823759 RepID=UPI00078DCBE6|nr:shikimate kinase [Desulfuromonas sp. DDH964]AMV71468.1 shikimate kinase [Desulfuromonas sp. DDH964]
MDRANLVMIGMPGAGKSTLGVLLAKRLGLAFIDTDLLIQARDGRRLQEIIAGDGLAAFAALEERVLLDLVTVRPTVIATGGSAVYSAAGMERLRRHGRTIFIDVPCAELEARLGDIDQRGLAIEPGESFSALFRRRHPLYLRYADLQIDGAGKGVETLLAEISKRLQSSLPSRA